MGSNDFINKITKMIEQRQGRIAAIMSEIDNLKIEIDAQRVKVNEFTDVNNVQTYTKLKDELKTNEDKLELLERSLKAEKITLNDDQINDIYNGFVRESEMIDKQCESQVIPDIKKIQKVCNDSKAKKDDLERLYNTWRSLFNVPANYCTVSPCSIDSTGMTIAVARMINTLTQAGKI